MVKEGAKVSIEELKEYVGEKLSKFKVPVHWYFTDIMPKTATGKVQRRIVAAEMLKPKKAKL